jgi:hypothetical protein
VIIACRLAASWENDATEFQVVRVCSGRKCRLGGNDRFWRKAVVAGVTN